MVYVIKLYFLINWVVNYLSASEKKKMRLKNRGRDKFINDINVCRWWGKIDKKCQKWWKSGGREKSTVRDFLDPKMTKMIKKGRYRDLWKNRPHKKHCAWARTPPRGKWWIVSIFSVFFWFWGVHLSRKMRD
jgi:hypothetical protein